MAVGTGLLALGGLGQGLMQGVDTFAKFRQLNDEKARRDKEEKLGSAKLGLLAQKEGYDFDPDAVSFTENDFGREKRAGLLRTEKLNEDVLRSNAGLKNALAQLNTTKSDAGLLKVSPGQQALDKEYGKKFAERTAGGGYADAYKGISQLDDAIKLLGDTDSATGPMVGLLPKTVRDVVTPGGAAIQDKVEEVVQRNLRQVLGAQFTEQEGKALIARAYNPRLSEGENIKRLTKLKMQMQQSIELQQAADDYFDKNGSMKGFKGKTFQSAGDFNLEDEVAPGSADLGFSKDDEKRLQALAAKLKK